jgi:hypothetical protein
LHRVTWDCAIRARPIFGHESCGRRALAARLRRPECTR